MTGVLLNYKVYTAMLSAKGVYKSYIFDMYMYKEDLALNYL